MDNNRLEQQQIKFIAHCYDAYVNMVGIHPFASLNQIINNMGLC